MKNITRIITITFVCFFAAVVAWGQSADESYKAFKSLRDSKEAKPSPAHFQKMCAAGVDFLVSYSSDAKKAKQVVNDMLSYGTNTLAKDKPQRAAWYSTVQFAIIEKQAGLDDKAKGAFAALSAAMAEGESLDNPTGQQLNDWRNKIEQLNTVSNGLPFLKDREEGFYKLAMKLKSGQKIVEEQLARLSQSKDRDTANWAKQEAKMLELRKDAFALSFTGLDGKAFDSTKLKGPPALYVYFWSVSGKNVASEASAFMDMYYEFTRRQVEFIAVCCDPEEKRADVQVFVKKQKIKCPVYFDGQGTKGELYQKLSVGNVSGGAIGYLFDKSGTFVQRGLKPSDLKKYIK